MWISLKQRQKRFPILPKVMDAESFLHLEQSELSKGTIAQKPQLVNLQKTGNFVLPFSLQTESFPLICIHDPHCSNFLCCKTQTS